MTQKRKKLSKKKNNTRNGDSISHDSGAKSSGASTTKQSLDGEPNSGKLEATTKEIEYTTNNTGTESNDTDNDNDNDNVHGEYNEKYTKLETKNRKRLRDSRRAFFFFGTLIGVIVAVYFGHKNTSTELSNSLFQFEFENIMNYENFQDVLDSWKPNLSNLVPKNLLSKKEEDLTANFALGKQLQKEFGLSVKHPVIMIPGVITTGLESWGLSGDEECDSEPHFRKRLWGSYYMLKTMLFNKQCWLKHLKLDPITGLDPPNFKLRASQGFEATDFFVAGYWIWNKVLQNLATLGYDSNEMVTASFDWRLAYLDLEKRDRYFSKLKEQVELMYSISNGEKSVLFSHSMGAQIAFYFLKWVEAEGEYYGNGGDRWCNKYIEAVVDIAGSSLGAPKAVPSLLSGEMKDTVQLNELAVYGLESFFSRRERLDLLRTFGGIPSMLPKGGDLIWGNLTHSVEDQYRTYPVVSYSSGSVDHRTQNVEEEEQEDVVNTGSSSEKKPNNKKKENDTVAQLISIPPPTSYGEFIRFSDDNTTLTVEESINYILENAPDWLSGRIEEQYSYGVAQTEEELQENNRNHKYWTNPLEVSLPYAPDMKIFSIYGVSNPAERSYVYKHENYTETGLRVTMDYEAHPSPVFLTDGDGTLPLMTHAMVHKWKQGVSPYNPAGINITVVELKHEPKKFDIRGGDKSSDHVDILGSAELNEYLLKIASGKGHLIEDKIISNITRWVSDMEFPI